MMKSNMYNDSYIHGLPFILVQTFALFSLLQLDKKFFEIGGLSSLPILSMVVVTSPSFSLCSMVVLPAAYRPATLKNDCNSFLIISYK